MPVRPPVFDERAIKAELLTKLWREGEIGKTTVLTSEYRLQDTGVRADLAILTNHLIGVEIKSGKDSLKRLSMQMEVYRTYFDRVILIVAPKHLSTLNDSDVGGVELWSFDSAKNFRLLKPGIVSDRSLARHSLLPERDQKRYAHLLERESFDMVFRERFHQTSDQFWKSLGRNRRVSVDSLKYLSRFRETREAHIEWALDQERRWSQWNERATQVFSVQGQSQSDLD